MKVRYCVLCLFCEEVGLNYIRCNNADVAKDFAGRKEYIDQGWIELPFSDKGQEACFWFVQKR